MKRIVGRKVVEDNRTRVSRLFNNAERMFTILKTVKTYYGPMIVPGDWNPIVHNTIQYQINELIKDIESVS